MKNLSNDQRRVIYEILLKHSQNGKLKKGSIASTTSRFSVTTKTISRIWKRGQNSSVTGIIDVSSRRIGMVGGKRVQIDFNQASDIPLRRRTNIRSLASAMSLSKSTLHRRVKEGSLRAHSNAIKPTLTHENKKARLKFCLSMVEQGTPFENPIFNGMYDCVHIDEKLFYMTKIAERYYLLPDESEPLRTCKSKKFITKVMFLAAVARPQFDENCNEFFSEKIGIFPFICKELAKRKSKNRDVGTLETKSIYPVTQKVFRSFLIKKVLPSIKEKWSSSSVRTPIFIQQDNAKPHVCIDDAEFVEHASRDGFDIRLRCQPPNSPDMNVLDLGFFRAIQTLQHQEAPTTIDELVAAVVKSFDQFSSKRLNYVLLTLQTCMVEVMKVFGEFDYKVSHMNKGRLEKDGNLPTSIQFERSVMDEVILHLQEP